MIFLGTIANLGSDVLNNTNTAVPFSIPVGITRLFLQPSTATMMGALSTTNGSFAPAAAAMLQLGGANSVNEMPVQFALTQGYEAQTGVTLAVRKTDAGAGTTKVFGV